MDPGGSRALIAAEEEQFVLHDRPADRSAELVALDRIASCSECVAGVEFSVSDEFKQIAVKFICAGLRHRLTEPPTWFLPGNPRWFRL